MAYEPKPEHKFTFGLWTIGSTGRDPFGAPVRDPKTPAELVYLLGEVGVHGVNFHDNDLIPIDAAPAEAEAIKRISARRWHTHNWSCCLRYSTQVTNTGMTTTV